MKLDDKEFAEFKKLAQLEKAGKLSTDQSKRFAELKAKKESKDGSNDPSWWKKYPSLVEASTNIPFNWLPGTKVEMASRDVCLGGVAIADYVSTIGHSTGDNRAFNTQMRNLWLDMHRKYRGMGGYQKSDLGMAILAIASVFTSIAKFERIYGVINTYSIMNRHVPATLKEALRITNDIEENIADFRYNLNFRIEQLGQLCLPKSLSIVLSDIVLNSNLFKDSNNSRAFIFGWDVERYGVYDPETLSTGGCVRFKSYSDHMNGVTPGQRAGFKMSDVFTILDEQINSLLNDDDIAKMCSDLLAAYGEGNVFTLVPVPEEYHVVPVEDEERKYQWHNMTLVGNIYSAYTGLEQEEITNLGSDIVIYQKDNVIINRITSTGSATTNAARVLQDDWSIVGTTNSNFNGCRPPIESVFDSWNDKPTSDEIMVGTRFLALSGARVVLNGTPLHYYVDLVAYGTALVTSLHLYFKNFEGEIGENVFNGDYYTTGNFLSDILPLRQCDWAPIFYYDDGDGVYIDGDVDNLTIVSRAQMEKIHDTAVLSAFKIDAVTVPAQG